MSYNPSNPNGQATMANSEPVVIASDQSAIPVTDNGGSITVDGTVAVSGSVAVTGPLTDAELRASALPVSVSNFPATQPVSGSVTVDNESISVSGFVTAETELPAANTLADGVVNPTTPIVGSAGLGFNGATWDRLRTDTALQGNGANDAVVGILAVGTGPGYTVRKNPANLGTAVNSVSTFNVDGANSVTIGINTTTTGTFVIEGTTDNTNWVALEVFEGSQDLWVTGRNITPTAARVYQLLTQGYRQVRLRTVTTLGATVAHFVTLSNAQQFIGGINTGAAPHDFGYVVRNFGTEYTTQQTGAAIWAPTAGRRFVVTDFTISTGGTTAGVVTLWQGASADTAYTVGTDPVLFRGEFAPSANARPGVVKQFAVPFVSSTVDHLLRITTSTAMTLYVQVNGYEI